MLVGVKCMFLTIKTAHVHISPNVTRATSYILKKIICTITWVSSEERSREKDDEWVDG